MASKIALFQRLTIRLDPEARSFRSYARANALRDAGQYDRALADYETALKLAPTNAWVLVDRRRAYARMGRSEAAKNDVDSALKLDPANEQKLRPVIEAELLRLGKALHLRSRHNSRQPLQVEPLPQARTLVQLHRRSRLLLTELNRWRSLSPSGRGPRTRSSSFQACLMPSTVCSVFAAGPKLNCTWAAQ